MENSEQPEAGQEGKDVTTRKQKQGSSVYTLEARDELERLLLVLVVVQVQLEHNLLHRWRKKQNQQPADQQQSVAVEIRTEIAVESSVRSRAHLHQGDLELNQN
jgi:hypothetical protein